MPGTATTDQDQRGVPVTGYKIYTDLPANKTYVRARQAAYKRHFALEDKGERAFVATKGSYWMSLFFGAFNVYCEFQLSVEDHGKATVVVLECNKPSGISGASGAERIKSRARELVNSIITEILAGGGKVLKENEY
jgi:hypothetical protein